MFNVLINKAYASADVAASGSISAMLTSMPFWIDVLSQSLQIGTLLIGIVVGISAYRLNEAKRKDIEDEE